MGVEDIENNNQTNTLFIMKTILMFLSIIVLLNASCRNRDNHEIYTLYAEEESYINDSTKLIKLLDNKYEKVKLSDVIDSVRYVDLEPHDDAYLSSVPKMRMTDSILYVMDMNSKLVCFDTDGKYLRPGYIVGNGPEEIVHLYDFDTDEENLYLLDGARSEIFVFNHSGKFVKTMKLPFRAHNIEKNGDRWLFYLSPFALDDEAQDYQVAITDSAFNIKKFYFNQCIGDRAKRSDGFENIIDAANFFTPIFGNGIYQMEKDSMTLKYYVDMGKRFPEEDISKFEYAIDNALWYVHHNPISDGKYIFLPFYTSKNQNGVLIIRNSDKRSIFIEDFEMDIPDVFQFNWEINIGEFNQRSNEFYGPMGTVVLENLDEDSRKSVKEWSAEIPDKYKNVLIKESNDVSNQLVIFVKLSDKLDKLIDRKYED